MVSDLCHLSRSDQGANGYKAAITRCQSWPKPQLTKQQVRGVLYEARGDIAEVVADLTSSLGLGFFIQWKQLVLRGWQLIDADSALERTSRSPILRKTQGA